MNLSLIDPFVLAQDYPDTLTEKISMTSTPESTRANADKSGSGHATCLRFNRHGDYLASGRVGTREPHRSALCEADRQSRWTAPL